MKFQKYHPATINQSEEVHTPYSPLPIQFSLGLLYKSSPSSLLGWPLQQTFLCSKLHFFHLFGFTVHWAHELRLDSTVVLLCLKVKKRNIAMRGVCLKGRALKGQRMCRLQRKEFYVGVSGHTAQVPKRSSLEFSAFPCIGSSFRTVAETDDKGSGILRASFWKCLMEMGRGDLQVSSLQKTACSAVKQLDAKSLAQSFQGARQMAALSTAAANSFIFSLFPGARRAQG